MAKSYHFDIDIKKIALLVVLFAWPAYADGGGFRIVNWPDVFTCNVNDFPTSYPVTGSVSVANFPATQPVSGTFWQATQPISGSVSVSNLPATQPVSGSLSVSNFPVTQPVSGTFWQNTQPVSGSLSVSNFPASQAVTGTFWQATQPISGAVSVSNFPATQPVSLASMPSTPVTGTFWQATQPISIASMPSTPVTGTFFQATQPVSGTVTVTPPSLTKGTQGATGLTVQSLKDAGRQYVVLVATGVAGVTTEALFSFQQNKQGVVTQGVSSYTIPSGKTLRLTGLFCSNRDGTTTTSWTRAVIRHNPNGATTANSGLVFGIETGSQAALAGSTGPFNAAFVDGIEIFGNGTQSIAVSHLDQATTNVVTCTLTGFEY